MQKLASKDHMQPGPLRGILSGYKGEEVKQSGEDCNRDTGQGEGGNSRKSAVGVLFWRAVWSPSPWTTGWKPVL